MVNYILAIVILTFWFFVFVSFTWNPKVSFITNLIIVVSLTVMLFLVYWIPFWLIFLK